LPPDVKKYSRAEARTEWDSAREAKRRMFLARINMRESEWASKQWDDLPRADQDRLKVALDEDFYAPHWYINVQGKQISFINDLVPAKPEQLQKFEDGEALWNGLAVHDRFSALLRCGIGAGAEEAKYVAWGRLSEELRTRLHNDMSTLIT
jgi:hypothetical protein